MEVTGFLIKVLMTCVTTFITNLKWMAVIQCSLALLLFWIYFKWVSLLLVVDCMSDNSGISMLDGCIKTDDLLPDSLMHNLAATLHLQCPELHPSRNVQRHLLLLYPPGNLGLRTRPGQIRSGDDASV